MKADERIISEKLHGKEPVVPITITEKDSTDLGKILNWYSSMADDKSIDGWAITYMKNKGYSKKDISSLINTRDLAGKKTTCALCRMHNNGIKFEGNVINLIDERIQRHISNSSEKTITPNEQSTQVISIQERINAVADKYIIEIEDEVDSWFFNKKKKIEFSMYTFLQKNNISVQVAKKVRKFLTPKIEELELAYLKKDELYVEAYSYLTKTRTKEILESLNNLIKDIDRFVGNTNSSKPRKQKKKKIIPIAKQINSLKYQKEFTSLKIKSVDPELIIGSQQLWIFNTKYNQVTVFNSLSSAGLGVKGTTIINFDEQTSQKKKVRKPKEIVEKILEGGKIVLRKVLSDLTTKPIPINGRINEDTILLRVIR